MEPLPNTRLILTVEGFDLCSVLDDENRPEPGDLVRHRGTLQWGQVQRVRSTHYGYEIEVRLLPRTSSDHRGTYEWSNGHVRTMLRAACIRDAFIFQGPMMP